MSYRSNANCVEQAEAVGGHGRALPMICRRHASMWPSMMSRWTSDNKRAGTWSDPHDYIHSMYSSAVAIVYHMNSVSHTAQTSQPDVNKHTHPQKLLAASNDSGLSGVSVSSMCGGAPNGGLAVACDGETVIWSCLHLFCR